ncbi:MAG: hypothetical protein WBP08_13165 [Saprospiraceae bacterium]
MAAWTMKKEVIEASASLKFKVENGKKGIFTISVKVYLTFG